jgi:hypothetical protein
MMLFLKRWGARRELKRAAILLEQLAAELPSSSLRILFPNLEPIEACNMLLEAARRIRRDL